MALWHPGPLRFWPCGPQGQNHGGQTRRPWSVATGVEADRNHQAAFPARSTTPVTVGACCLVLRETVVPRQCWLGGRCGAARAPAGTQPGSPAADPGSCRRGARSRRLRRLHDGGRGGALRGIHRRDLPAVRREAPAHHCRQGPRADARCGEHRRAVAALRVRPGWRSAGSALPSAASRTTTGSRARSSSSSSTTRSTTATTPSGAITATTWATTCSKSTTSVSAPPGTTCAPASSRQSQTSGRSGAGRLARSSGYSDTTRATLHLVLGFGG